MHTVTSLFNGVPRDVQKKVGTEMCPLSIIKKYYFLTETKRILKINVSFGPIGPPTLRGP